MGTLGSPGELLRLSEHYRGMTDEELIALAQNSSELTEMAQQSLAMEISQRRLKVPPAEMARPRGVVKPPAPSSEDNEEGEDPYAEDRELFEICKVWSLRDALQVQRLLDSASIPFFIGPQNATGVDAGTMNFSEGLSVKIMRIGWPWAWEVMQNYSPRDAPPEPKLEELGEGVIRCPRCRATEAVFDKLTRDPADPESPPKFKWTCSSCGHQWEDEGVLADK
jgi:DNA-directed RNA polymerase subunit M/transcription elongation factor TFIIS